MIRKASQTPPSADGLAQAGKLLGPPPATACACTACCRPTRDHAFRRTSDLPPHWSSSDTPHPASPAGPGEAALRVSGAAGPAPPCQARTRPERCRRVTRVTRRATRCRTAGTPRRWTRSGRCAASDAVANGSASRGRAPARFQAPMLACLTAVVLLLNLQHLMPYAWCLQLVCTATATCAAPQKRTLKI